MKSRSGRNAEVPNVADTSLLRAFADLNFSKSEARVLLSMLPRRHPTPLATVARESGLPRSTAHSAIRTLAARGFIFCQGRYPARYRVAPAARFTSLAARRLELARRAAAAADLISGASFF